VSRARATAPAAIAQPLDGEPRARVLVAGASGFTGALAANLVWHHPRLELAAATSRGDAGTRLDRLYPRYRVPMELTELELDSAVDCDAALVAYPHGAAAELVAQLHGAGLAVVDISADFRLHDPSVYERTYGEHGAPQLLGQAVYGLTELHRDAIREAKLVANPGCYPTAALLALAPLAEAGLAEDAVISAASGVSGAGRGGGDGLHFVNVDENFSPYGVEGHRHAPEIEQELADLMPPGTPPPPESQMRRRRASFSFVPHLLPLDQGLLASCFVRLSREATAEDLRSLYEERYGAERFVEVVDAPPGVREVRDTNLCRVHVALDGDAGRALVFAAIDNLWKGASGQAIQNLNLMLGLAEEEGLR
jgi:N-acetyl-gamma-glutamyl-phosphate reductase